MVFICDSLGLQSSFDCIDDGNFRVSLFRMHLPNTMITPIMRKCFIFRFENIILMYENITVKLNSITMAFCFVKWSAGNWVRTNFYFFAANYRRLSTHTRLSGNNLKYLDLID